MRDVDLGETFLGLERRLAGAGGALVRSLADLMLRRTREAFDRQGRTAPWAPRRVPSVLGAIRDLALGPVVRPSRFAERPVLVDTGALRASVFARPAGPFAFDFGSRLAYAGKHEKGDVARVSVTDRVLDNLRVALRSDARLRPLGFLFRFRGREYQAPVQKREIAALTAQDRRDLAALVERVVAGRP